MIDLREIQHKALEGGVGDELQKFLVPTFIVTDEDRASEAKFQATIRQTGLESWGWDFGPLRHHDGSPQEMSTGSPRRNSTQRTGQHIAARSLAEPARSGKPRGSDPQNSKADFSKKVGQHRWLRIMVFLLAGWVQREGALEREQSTLSFNSIGEGNLHEIFHVFCLELNGIPYV